MKRCLVILDQPEHAPALLNAAAQLVTLTGLHTLDVLALRPDADATTTTQAPAEAFLFEEQHRGRVAALHTQFCHWLQTEYQHAKKQVEDTIINWLVFDKNNSSNVNTFSQKADIILATMPQGENPARITEQALFGLERPVLLVPPYWEGTYGASALVVWDNSSCAYQILQASRALLSQAAQLYLLAPKGQSLPYSLLPSTMMEEQRLGQPFSLSRILQAAATARPAYPADLVVLGYDWRGQSQMATQQHGSVPNSSASTAFQSVSVPLLVWGGVGS